MKIALVAIAKDEGKAILEWVAYYLGLGFDDIYLYDNESSDGTVGILRSIKGVAPVHRIFWESVNGRSPQVSAYNSFLENYGEIYDWVAFFDLDEFLVINDGRDIKSILSSYDQDTSAVGVNWLTFGSSGQKARDYESVVSTFNSGPARHSGNNYHIKTILRPSCVERMRIHNCDLRAGHYKHPNGEFLEFPNKLGISGRIEHSVFQLNHYQIKSLDEFSEKIARGRAGKRIGDVARVRKNPEKLLAKLDVMDEVYDTSYFEGVFSDAKAQAILDFGKLENIKPKGFFAIHVGYPKTATSFLQSKVFVNSAFNFVHRDNNKDLVFEINSFIRSRNRKNISDRLKKMLCEGDVLVSHENYTVPVNLMWDAQFNNRVGVDDFVKKISYFKSFAESDFKIIVTLRRQDFWLASRYSESAKNMQSPSTLDFERHIKEILYDDALRYSWLCYDKLVESLYDAIGEESVLVLFQEELALNPELWRFYLNDFLFESYPQSAFGSSGNKVNALGSGENTWSLKGHSGVLRLSPEISDEILSVVYESNCRLGNVVNKDLKEIGYI